MADKKFEWTDELWSEFNKSILSKCKMDTPLSYIFDKLDEFKKAKQQEQQSKRDWEVLTMVDGNGWVHPYDRTDIPCCDKCKIYSVKRLSDGEVFSVGDEISVVVKATIKSFSINGDECIVFSNELGGWPIDKINKVEKPKPLFVTEDGVEVFDKNGVCYKVGQEFEIEAWQAKYRGDGTYWKWYASEQNAVNWVLMNKPLLSLEDLLSVWNNDSEYQQKREVIEKCLLFNNFKKLAKSKLNTK